MVGILVSFWEGIFSGAMLVSGSVYLPTRWWFQIFFCFHPENWGRFPFWLIFFQRGWNHQLAYIWLRFMVKVGKYTIHWVSGFLKTNSLLVKIDLLPQKESSIPTFGCEGFFRFREGVMSFEIVNQNSRWNKHVIRFTTFKPIGSIKLAYLPIQLQYDLSQM